MCRAGNADLTGHMSTKGMLHVVLRQVQLFLHVTVCLCLVWDMEGYQGAMAPVNGH